MRAASTLVVFALTLALILIRPRGLHEAWATMLGGGLMLELRLETPAQAWRTVAQGADVLLFLLGLLILSEELRASGANTGSLLLPVSNLTNLLFVSAFHWSFGRFVPTMALPQAAALLANFWLFRRLFAWR